MNLKTPFALLLTAGLITAPLELFANGGGFTDAADFGFLPTASGVSNTKALQKAVDNGGTILITKPGTYKVAGTVYIGDSTSLVFGDATSVEKSAENGKFGYVFLNKGALTKTYNYHISITGLTLKVNGVDTWMGEIYGQRGHISLVWIKDLVIDHLRCMDLASGQFCLQVVTFEDVLINDVIIRGKKDGVHLGRGRRFKISNCVFETADDAIALAAGDWVSGNPEFGDIEDGVIENCHDLPAAVLQGGFAKIVASAWVDWRPGMKVRHGDAVVSNGRIYRVLEQIDGKIYTSETRPAFDTGQKKIDGINWLMYQKDTFHTAVVRNVVFRDIFLHSNRIPFQIMCYANNYAHSYYPGASMPVQGNISLENINLLSTKSPVLVEVSTPVDLLMIRNSTLQKNVIVFNHASDFATYPPTYVNVSNCVFVGEGSNTIIRNESPGKEVFLKTSGSQTTGKNFTANVEAGKGIVHVDSDLEGLKRP